MKLGKFLFDKFAFFNCCFRLKSNLWHYFLECPVPSKRLFITKNIQGKIWDDPVNVAKTLLNINDGMLNGFSNNYKKLIKNSVLLKRSWTKRSKYWRQSGKQGPRQVHEFRRQNTVPDRLWTPWQSFSTYVWRYFLGFTVRVPYLARALLINLKFVNNILVHNHLKKL